MHCWACARCCSTSGCRCAGTARCSCWPFSSPGRCSPSCGRGAGTEMALTATIYAFDVQLDDADRGVYETLALRVARHPSETEASLVTRVLAYCLEYVAGIAFSNGLAEP